MSPAAALLPFARPTALVPFALGTASAEGLSVEYDQPDADEGVQLADPWNFWVFEVGLNGDVEGEDRQSAIEFEGSDSLDDPSKVGAENKAEASP